MDSPLRVSEPLPDLAAAERAGEGRWRDRGRPRGDTRPRAKKRGSASATASDGRVESYPGEDDAYPPQTGPGDGTSGDRELSAACYGPDKAIALQQPSKGRLIDIAV